MLWGRKKKDDSLQHTVEYKIRSLLYIVGYLGKKKEESEFYDEIKGKKKKNPAMGYLKSATQIKQFWVTLLMSPKIQTEDCIMHIYEISLISLCLPMT